MKSIARQNLEMKSILQWIALRDPPDDQANEVDMRVSPDIEKHRRSSEIEEGVRRRLVIDHGGRRHQRLRSEFVVGHKTSKPTNI